MIRSILPLFARARVSTNVIQIEISEQVVTKGGIFLEAPVSGTYVSTYGR
jgi:hypothetical protein